LDGSILAQKSEFAKWMFSQTSAPKPDCCKTYSSWILTSTIQNHPWGVSSELGWLRSSGLAVMMVGGLNSGSKIRICSAEFSTDLSTQTRLLQDLQLMDPHIHHPKSSMGCIK
jgi:hypothetical protein